MNNKERSNNSNWYNSFVALSAALTLMLGIGAFGYGAIRSISDSIKNHRTAHKNSSKKLTDTVLPFNEAQHRMTDASR